MGRVIACVGAAILLPYIRFGENGKYYPCIAQIPRERMLTTLIPAFVMYLYASLFHVYILIVRKIFSFAFAVFAVLSRYIQIRFQYTPIY